MSSHRRADSARQCASRYTIYSRYISLLQSNCQEARANSIRAQAIEGFDEGDRTDHSLFLRLMHDQLALYQEQQNDTAVDDIYSIVIGKFRRIFGPKHWKTITVIHEYGQILCGAKRYEQAEALYRTFVHEVDEDHGPDSVPVLCIFNALGTVYAGRRKLKKAETILSRALVGFERQTGEKDSRTLIAAFNLAGVYQDRGKLSHAIHMYQVAAYGFKDVMCLSYSTTITAFTQLAALCSARRVAPEAKRAYISALQGLEEAARQDSIDALILKLDLGILHRDEQRLDDAEQLLKEVCQRLQEARSGYAPGALTCLGTVYARQGRVAEAETSFADAAREFSEHDEQFSVMSYATSFNLGLLLRSQRRLAEAEAMYRQVWDGARSVGGLKHAAACTIAEALGSLCEEQGKYEEAEEVYDQILASDGVCLDRWTNFVMCTNFHKMTAYS
ncbi:hypothetical protein MY1884_003975 [Beauveria asiatica]